MVCAPYLSRAADRPEVTHGVQSGDVSGEGAVVWSRTDRPSLMQVEWSTTESFREIGGAMRLAAGLETDFTAKAMLTNLPTGQDIFYRVRFLNASEPNVGSAIVTGRFRTPSSASRDITFLWTGDTAGQGWGIDLDRGGMRGYEIMRRNRPDFFIHSGDTVYADNAILPEQKMPGSGIWKNVVLEEKAKAAETLSEFRASFKYNLMDSNVLAFNAEVPGYYQWDDHEVTDNWWPDQPLNLPDHRARKYTETNIRPLVARANRAFHEFLPVQPATGDPARIYRKVGYGPSLDLFFLDMRSYRAANGDNRQATYGPDAHCLGPQQIAWLKRELKASRATWKVIAADQPISLYVADDWRKQSGSEAIAQNDHGAPLGRELEIADILSFMKREKISNTVWLTADVHYTAAHYYNPDKAAFQDFEPFWEFVSGPIHSGTFGPNPLDGTFGPELKFIKAPTKEQGVNLPPSAGLQFFGHVKIDGKSEAMTVTLKDIGDAPLWSVVLEPRRTP
jgi:alkaline phosphatase D